MLDVPQWMDGTAGWEDIHENASTQFVDAGAHFMHVQIEMPQSAFRSSMFIYLQNFFFFCILLDLRPLQESAGGNTV